MRTCYHLWRPHISVMDIAGPVSVFCLMKVFVKRTLQKGNGSLGEAMDVSEGASMGSGYKLAPFWRCCPRGAGSPHKLAAPEHKQDGFLLHNAGKREWSQSYRIGIRSGVIIQFKKNIIIRMWISIVAKSSVIFPTILWVLHWSTTSSDNSSV